MRYGVLHFMLAFLCDLFMLLRPIKYIKERYTYPTLLAVHFIIQSRVALHVCEVHLYVKLTRHVQIQQHTAVTLACNVLRTCIKFK
jgi:hypothetical protein